MGMESVWRDAETGLANTSLVNDLGIEVYRNRGPSGEYQVAWMMVFLDGIFSEATNNLISWVGIQRREGDGGVDTNRFKKEDGGAGGEDLGTGAQAEREPWFLLANSKWGMIENIVGATARDPDVRDALVTFLASECGDQFKRGVHSGYYSAASQSRGATTVKTVFIGQDGGGASGEDGDEQSGKNYQDFVRGMDTEAIPTPRSIIRLFNSPGTNGSFRNFSPIFSDEKIYSRYSEILCSEYLYTIIQAMRWEAGHAYHQLVRSFPDGFQSEESALSTLYYGWNLRKNESSVMIKGEEIKSYTRHLILAHLVRNELMYAPQITESGQRFAPSEQVRNFSESYVRTQGSRAKYGELYNWAVMMPQVQGILTYLVLIGYPFAAMLMVIPGYWKAFFTWISFFAWVKLWDVGFAIVHTLERSVWAMIGNHSAMAKVGRRLIVAAEKGNSDVNVTCPEDGGMGIPGKLSQLCAVPEVKSAGGDQNQIDAWYTLDQILVVAGSLDLDLSNGYYIYIMAALYFAVPTVTGQLVLGAKASLGGIATQAMGQSAGEAGGASKSGTVGEGTNRLMTNQASMNQAAMAKSYRQSGLALRSLEAQNAASDMDVLGAEIGINKGAAGAAADAIKATMGSNEAFGGAQQAIAQNRGFIGGKLKKAGNRVATTLGLSSPVVNAQSGVSLSSGVDSGGDDDSASSEGDSGGNDDSPSSIKAGDPAKLGAFRRPKRSGRNNNNSASNKGESNRTSGRVLDGVNDAANLGLAIFGQATDGKLAQTALSNLFAQQYAAALGYGSAYGLDAGMQKSGLDLYKSGMQAYGQNLQREADFEANMAAWDARNAFATHISGTAGVAGINPGSLAPGAKPTDMGGLAASGALGSKAREASYYSMFGYNDGIRQMFARSRGKGGQAYMNHFNPFGSVFEYEGAMIAAGIADFMKTGAYLTPQPWQEMKEGTQRITSGEDVARTNQVIEQIQQQVVQQGQNNNQNVPTNNDRGEQK
jgi:hypothetical protein